MSRTLLVVTAGNPEQVALEFIAKGVAGDLITPSKKVPNQFPCPHIL